MGLPVLWKKREVVRSSYDAALSFDDFVGLVTQFGFNGVQYSQPAQSQEAIAPQFAALARAAYKSNGVVFACMTVRQQLLAQARFAFRERRNGRPGNLFTTAALAPLEAPWPNATTGNLITRMEMYGSLAGNFFGTNRYGGVRSLRPDWVKILVGSQADAGSSVWDADAEVVGYAYQPGGPGSGRPIETFLPEEIAHYAPIPDPEAQFRGMSWLTPIVREVMGDKAMTDHKLMFLENGATPNMVVKMDVEDINQWVTWIRKFSEDHEGVRNAYKTMYLGAGMDATVVGKDLQQIDFKAVQGAGETRIAAAAGTPPVVVGLSEGLQGSSLNAGNFEASMARLRDITIRPLLAEMAGSLASIIAVPQDKGRAELWYDDRDVPAFQEDIRKAGERLQADTTAMSTLIMAGYEPDSVTDAVTSGDLSRLVHSGLPSVQVQSGPANGNGNGAKALPAAPADSGGNGKRSEDMLQELLRVSESRRPVEIHNHMPELEPARVDVHTTVEAAEPQHITVEAARAPDVHVAVEPARVENVFAEGSIRVDAPVTVEPSTITVEAAPAPDVNVRVDPAQVTGEAAQVTVEAPPPAEVNVRVEAAPTPDVNVHVDPPDVTVEAPEIHVHTPEPQRPRNARATRGEDGSLTVSYDDEEKPDGGSEPES